MFKVNPELGRQDKTEIRAEQKKKLKKLGTIRLHPGHRLFRIDTRKHVGGFIEGTLDDLIEEVTDKDYDWTETDLDGNGRKKLRYEEGVFYFPALNRKNALKKALKSGILFAE
jgi:hypothetical protein